MHKILKRYWVNLLVTGFFGLMTFVTLDNLILNFGTAIPDTKSNQDYAIPYWSLWWAKHALLDLHTDPMFTNYIVFPNKVNLTLHTHILTLGILSLPFQYFLDMRLIVNGIIVLSFLLSSTLMFAFLRRHVQNTWLAVLGATIYAFSPGLLWRATQVHLNTLSIWWLPLNLLLWDKVLERRSMRWAVALGLAIYLGFMNYSESILWMLLTLPPYMVYGLLTQKAWRARWQTIGLGDPSRPLPFMLLYKLTNGQYRTPVRLLTPATLALVIFVVLSLDNLFDRLRRPWIQRVLVAGIIAIYVVDIGILEPFPIRTVPDYPVYRLVGADPEDHTLLQVPIGPASGGRSIGHAEQLAYYARFHHQRTVNGLVSRLPAPQLNRYSNSTFLRALARMGPLPPFDTARSELVRRLTPWDIRYIVVRKDLMDEDEATTFITFFNQQPELCVFDNAQDTIAYRVIASWADCPTPAKSALLPGGKLDLGEPGDEPFIGRGWYRAENIGGPQGRWAGESITSTLRLVLPAESLRVHFRASAYPVGQSVTITVNGFPATSIALVNDWAEYEFGVPADATRAEGPSLITLTHTRLESAFERTSGAVEDKRLLAAAHDYLVFEPAC